MGLLLDRIVNNSHRHLEPPFASATELQGADRDHSPLPIHVDMFCFNHSGVQVQRL